MPSLLELIQIAAKQFPVYISSMNHAIIGREMQQLKNVAHKLRGSAANIGFMRLAEFAGKIEEKAEKDEAVILREIFQDLGREWDYLAAVIKRMVSSGTN